MLHQSETLFFAMKLKCFTLKSFYSSVENIECNRQDETLFLEILFSHKFIVCAARTWWNFVIFVNCNVLRTVGADISSTARLFTSFDYVIHINLLYIVCGVPQRNLIVCGVELCMHKSNFQYL